MILQFSSEKRRKKHKTETKSSSKVGHFQWQMVVNNVNSGIMSSVGDPKYMGENSKTYLKPPPGYKCVVFFFFPCFLFPTFYLARNVTAVGPARYIKVT